MKRRHDGSEAARGATRREFLRQAGAAAAGAALAGALPRIARAAEANERLGIGFIGSGGRAGAHMQVTHWLKENAKYPVDLVAVCDAYRPRMQRAAEAYGMKGTMDHRDLLKDPNVDVVCIATPDHVHAPQAIDALRAGKHVYCEKPVTHWRQYDLVRQLADEAKKSGRAFQVGTQGMSDAAWHQIAKLVKQGAIGRPIHAECGYFRVGDWGERGMPIDDPKAVPGKDLNWEAFLGGAPKRDFDVSRFFRWRMYEDYAGGPVTDLFPHSLTPVVHMLGVTVPQMVVASGGIFRYPEREVPDTFNMLIDYPEKVTVAVLGTQGNNDPTTPARGAGGRVPVLRGWDGSLTVRGNEIVLAPAEGSDKKPQTWPIERGEDMAEYWKKFLDCCREGRQDTYAPADLAYHVQTALIMGMWSLRQGKVAKFDPAKREIVM
jgi:predicted dehydrogenase